MMRLMSRIHTRYPVQRHRGCSRDTYETRYSTVIVEPVFGGLWARNVSIGGRAVADRKRGNEIVLSNTTH